MLSELGASWETIILVVISTTGVYLSLVLFSRIAGLRSFAEMTNFDLAATVIFGSMAATTAVSTSTSLLQGVVGLAVLFVVQALIALLRRRQRVARVLDNRPLLLMDGATVLADNLARARMTHDDLRAKLRLAGVVRGEQVSAVVLETTGSVSVLTVDPGGRALDPTLLQSVIGADRLREPERAAGSAVSSAGSGDQRI
ncbi:MAG: DUF421 domain-containing protein [Brachybacterium sp.]|uniref:DUF421 domain-containing protein n=1 Tax=Brachybacterium sp. TaxID=1891286 RepID=UPI002648C1E3|nr:YetF domain-containing protein [Brachybacterium sp.]MDN5685325.1 DUF421 domain-containing protein [Brachybacterium sp.]